MSIIYKINGQIVTKRQWDTHSRKRKAIYGDQFAEMLATQSPPSIRTNDTFMRGKKQGADLDMTEETFQHYKRKAAKAGVDVTGKYYYGTLATRPGDPSAWCGSISEAKAAAKRKEMLLETNVGNWDYRSKYRDDPDDLPYEVAPDIVAREVAEQIKQEGGKVDKRRREQIEQEVREDITPTF